ncbi:hypothetical protein [Sutcliffiella deserti]|uniref:hypothetical protein n=1 Tax=Sutcliffiella deserti TaxID=2875501 RepID=UPI001CC0076A|nr:hypothetical protein [Sutcliffiella deserti]
MTAITHRFIPLIRKRFTGFSNWTKDQNFKSIGIAMEAYWLRFIIVSCLSPVFLIIPAFMFKLATEPFSVLGYLLGTVLLIPWLLIPTLFIQNITNHSKTGKVLSLLYLSLMVLIFILWLIFI